MRFGLAIVLVFALVASAYPAEYQTANFRVTAPTSELAQKIAKQAEVYRRDFALEWLGATLPQWSEPCPIAVQVGPLLGAGGSTSFQFYKGEVFGWTMAIQGSEERLMDSVLPHEILHTVFACHFRCPLPRWCDEGLCTTVEHVSEQKKHQKLLNEFLQTGRGIAFNQMFLMKEYPSDILPLYAQGYSLSCFLLMQRDKKTFLRFIEDGIANKNWTRAVGKFYGYGSLKELQNKWLDWVKAGSPELKKE